MKLERYNYYSGKASPEAYVEELIAYKVRDKESMTLHMNADEKFPSPSQERVQPSELETLKTSSRWSTPEPITLKCIDPRFQSGMGSK